MNTATQSTADLLAEVVKNLEAQVATREAALVDIRARLQSARDAERRNTEALARLDDELIKARGELREALANQ